MAFDVLEPLGNSGDDYRLAYLLANTMNATTGGKWVGPPQRHDPDREPWTIEDFTLRRSPTPVAGFADHLSLYGDLSVDTVQSPEQVDFIMSQAGFFWDEED